MSLAGKLATWGILIDTPGDPIEFSNGVIPQTRMGRGDAYFVDPANGSDNNDGKSPFRAKATLAAGYAALTANQNDILFLIGGATSATISDTLEWAKSYTHLVGIASPAPNSRARITVTGTDSATAGLVISGSGCIFENFRIYQETSFAGCGAIEVTGDRNYFYNCDIQGMVGALAKASALSYSLLLNGAEENRFERCSAGLDTVVRTEGSVLRFDGSSARNEFLDCIFKSACETAAKPMAKYVDTSALDRYMLFKNCIFYNFSANHAVTLTEAFTVPNSAATHDIILDNCSLIGIAEWDSNDRGHMWINMTAATAEDGGLMVAPINT